MSITGIDICDLLNIKLFAHTKEILCGKFCLIEIAL